MIRKIKNITPAAMSNIDIVAGTMTTLLYDLLPYGKPIWIFETPFKLQQDMVDNGLARLISYDDLDNIDTPLIYKFVTSEMLKDAENKSVVSEKKLKEEVEEEVEVEV
jgi:hypothetical protein